MQKEAIKLFLDNMFQNRNLFMQIHGVNNISNPKYMLIADYLSEDTESLSKIIYNNLYHIKPCNSGSLKPIKKARASS